MVPFVGNFWAPMVHFPPVSLSFGLLILPFQPQRPFSGAHFDLFRPFLSSFPSGLSTDNPFPGRPVPSCLPTLPHDRGLVPMASCNRGVRPLLCTALVANCRGTLAYTPRWTFFLPPLGHWAHLGLSPRCDFRGFLVRLGAPLSGFHLLPGVLALLPCSGHRASLPFSQFKEPPARRLLAQAWVGPPGSVPP